MDNVAFTLCHLYSMYRFLLFCHNKRPSYKLDFIIEEPLMTYLQKKFHTAMELLNNNVVALLLFIPHKVPHM